MSNFLHYTFVIIIVIILLTNIKYFVKCTIRPDPPIYYGPYSSCHLTKDSTKEKWSEVQKNKLKWIRGSGVPIQSWISSILPVFADSPAKLKWNHPKGLYAKFKSSPSRHEKLFEVIFDQFQLNIHNELEIIKIYMSLLKVV